MALIDRVEDAHKVLDIGIRNTRFFQCGNIRCSYDLYGKFESCVGFGEGPHNTMKPNSESLAVVYVCPNCNLKQWWRTDIHEYTSYIDYLECIVKKEQRKQGKSNNYTEHKVAYFTLTLKRKPESTPVFFLPDEIGLGQIIYDSDSDVVTINEHDQQLLHRIITLNNTWVFEIEPDFG